MENTGDMNAEQHEKNAAYYEALPDWFGAV